MKIQLAIEIPTQPGADGAGILEDLVAAEDQGFDGLWLMDPTGSAAEPSIHLAAAWLAARTAHIAIGLRLSLPVALHPLRLAEELALLDLMCDGRLGCSVAADPDAPDAAAEQLEIALKAWTGERFSHAGEFFDVPDLQCLPRPARETGPALWVAASHPRVPGTGRDSGGLARWAAATGRPLWIDAAVPEDTCAELLETHAEAAARAGHPPCDLSPRVVRRVRLDGESTARAEDGTTISGDPSSCRDRLLALGERLRLDTLVCWLDRGPAPQTRLAELMLS